MRSNLETSPFLKNREKRIYYKNDHDQQQFFSIQRNQNQPSRHFSPEKQYLELPIVKNGNLGDNKQKHTNDLKNALYQTRKFRNGSLYDNYYSLIQQVKKRRNLNEDDDGEVEEFTYQTSECNRNKILANALFNMNTSHIQQNHVNQQTCFNLDVHLWSNKQKQNLNNSQFVLTTIPQYALVCNKINKNARNFSLPPNIQGRNSDTSQILNQTFLNTNTSLLSKKNRRDDSGSKKFITQQASLSPKKESIFNDNLELKQQIVTIPKKKILEINFASRFNRKIDDNKKTFKLMNTPYIDKAIQIIEEKQTLDQKEDEDFLLNFPLKNLDQKVDVEKDPFIKIDGGYGDYILRYHHIKQRIQNKLIPGKVPLPEQKKIYKTYEDYEQDQYQQQISHQLELLLQKDNTPTESKTYTQPDEIKFKV